MVIRRSSIAMLLIEIPYVISAVDFEAILLGNNSKSLMRQLNNER